MPVLRVADGGSHAAHKHLRPEALENGHPTRIAALVEVNVTPARSVYVDLVGAASDIDLAAA